MTHSASRLRRPHILGFRPPRLHGLAPCSR